MMVNELQEEKKMMEELVRSTMTSAALTPVSPEATEGPKEEREPQVQEAASEPPEEQPEPETVPSEISKEETQAEEFFATPVIPPKKKSD